MSLEEGPLHFTSAWPSRISELAAVVANPIVASLRIEVTALAIIEHSLNNRIFGRPVYLVLASHKSWKATFLTPEIWKQALHRVRERFVSQRTGIINQIRAFMLERGIAVRQGPRFLRAALPGILASLTDVLSPRMLRVIEALAMDSRQLDERIDGLSAEIEAVASADAGCDRLMSIPGLGPIIAIATVAAIGAGLPAPSSSRAGAETAERETAF